LAKGAGSTPRFFVDATVIARSTCDEAIHIAATQKAGLLRFARNDGEMCYMTGMFPDRQTIVSPIVIDDRCRLPGRFFGRFATSATSELTRAR
jgi:hypothetical protein